MNVGIVSYGAYVPRYRIKPEEIGRVWGVDGKAMGIGLKIDQKSIPAPDEDVVTIASEAARYMMARVPEVDPKEIGAVYVGSESHPYAVKPTSGIVAEVIQATPALTAADLEFACKAGTAGIQMCMGLVGSGMMKYGVAVGADTSQGAPGDALEYSASAGGAAYLIGKDKVIAKINKTVSFTTDTLTSGEGRSALSATEAGSPGTRHISAISFRQARCFSRHAEPSPKITTRRSSTSPTASSPEGRQNAGIHPEQIENGLLTPSIGNTYSGAVPLGLANVLDKSKPGDRIFVTSYGSGAGSDSFDITVTDEMKNYKKDNAPTVEKVISNPVHLDYAMYAKYKGKIIMPE